MHLSPTIKELRMGIYKNVILTLQIVTAFLLMIPLLTFVLALLTWMNQQLRAIVTGKPVELNTALYCGRVSHTRFRPIIHSFSYPLFFCLLDLSEISKLFEGTIPFMWPLNYLLSFRNGDHLKNGEGTSSKSVSSRKDPLEVRIRKLVREKTNGKFCPTPQNQILLLTHLSYFGYCFNPVSFYYIFKDTNMPSADPMKDKGKIEAIVAEVSNTPWNEMHCYVLHPDSVDMMEVKDGLSRNHNFTKNENANDDEDLKDWKSINYIFKKSFHVSPFMDMDHIYDWTFWNIDRDRVMVSTSMLKEREHDDDADADRKEPISATSSSHNRVKFFNAFFDIHKTSFSSFHICYQLMRFPVYCMIIQVWIHIQAFKLFIKGVEFIPHPKGSETFVSSAIATLMAPFFAAKAWLARKENVDSKKIQ